MVCPHNLRVNVVDPAYFGHYDTSFCVYDANGCLLEHDVKRSFSSAKILEIVDWKSEIHRLITPREIVKGILIQ